MMRDLLLPLTAVLFFSAGCANVRPEPARQDPARVGASESARVLERLEPLVRFTNVPEPPLALEQRMEHYRVPAVSIAVIDRDRIAWTVAVGIKRAGSDERVTTETLFHVKSLSKPVAAVAALDVVEEGLLQLDAPISESLHSWMIPDNEHVRTREPTLRHLLSHRAGFTRGGVDSYLPDQKIPTLLQSLAGETPADAGPLDITFEPGTRSRYSGGGYGVLQQLLIDVEEESFPELMERRVFDPIGMTHSFYLDGAIPDTLLPFVALGHDSEGDLVPGGYEILPIMAAGGLWSTPRDLARFVIELQRSWEGRSEKVLVQSSLREMMSSQGDEWGLGIQLDDHDGAPLFTHSGSGDGFKAVAVGYLGTGQGAVIAANGDGAGELRYEILRAIAREYGWPGFDDSVEYEVADVSAEELARLVGTYRWESGLVNEVALEEGVLWTRFGENSWRRLYPLSARRFVTTANEVHEFRGEHGKTLVYIDEGGEYEATRVDSAVAD